VSCFLFFSLRLQKVSAKKLRHQREEKTTMGALP